MNQEVTMDTRALPGRVGDVWAGRHGWVSPERYDELAADASNALPVFNYSSQHGKQLPLITPEPTQLELLTAVMESLLQNLDPQPSRGGLVETPLRAAKAWQDWTSGYRMNAESLLKTFEDGAEGCDEMVAVRNIPFYSHCEHHLAPIFGTATVGYLPNKRIVGLSKLARLVDMHARRLQVQERMTNDIAADLMKHLAPLGVGVVVRARHLCMESRGVECGGTDTVTSSMHGLFRSDSTLRAEFLALTR